jgi:hypothetical protein
MSTHFLTPTNVQKAKLLIQRSNQHQPNSIPWNDIQVQLYSLLASVRSPQRNPLKSTRLLYYSSHIYEDVVIPILKAEPGKHLDYTLENAWFLIAHGMAAPEKLDRDNIETLRKGVELGFIDLAVRELSFNPLRYNGRLMDFAFLAITSPAAYFELSVHVVSSGALPACLELIRNSRGGDLHSRIVRDNLTCSIRTLNSVMRYYANAVRGLVGVIEAVQPYLSLLARHDQHQQQQQQQQQLNDEDGHSLIMLGFSSARLLIRASNSQDVSQIIRDNPFLLTFYPKLMRQVMDVGISNNYNLYSLFWVLAGICLDVSILAISYDDTDALVSICPLIIEMMVYHHHGDYDLMKYGLIFLSTVIRKNSIQCLQQIIQQKIQLQLLGEIILSDYTFDKETVSLLRDVWDSVKVF